MNRRQRALDPIQTILNNGLLSRCVELYALGALLALIDAFIHGQLETLLENPLIMGRSLTWMAIFYGTPNLLLALLLRNRRWVVGLVLFGFILAQGGLWFYRSEIEGSLASFHTLLLLSGIFLVAFVAAWRLSRLQENLPGLSRAAYFLVVVLMLVACVSFLVPIPPPHSPEPWPQTPEAVPGRQGKPNVLLITLDTVRPDHLGAYHYNKILTPNLDKLAAEGVLFLRGISQAPVTPVSHASILTGVYPPKHRLRNFEHNNQLSTKNPLLSEILRKNGYFTGAIIASTTLDPLFGLDRGFDVYNYVASSETYLFSGLGRSLLPTVMQLLGVVKDRTAYRSGIEQTNDALLWLDKYKDVPFFLWLHYFDAHDPYFPSTVSRKSKRHPGRNSKELSGRGFDYDCEIIGLDDQIGHLTDRLREDKILDDTIIAVISDHGEGLGEHNYIGHTKRIYEEQLRLVLFLRYPERIRAGQIVSAQVRSIDLAPTILDLLGIQIPQDLDGLSLLPLMNSGGNSKNRVAFSETFAPDEQALHLVAVNDGRYKLIRSLGGSNWLYDIEKDPGEHRNIAKERPAEVTRLGALLDIYLSKGEQAKDGDTGSVMLDEEIREKLQALGYINN